MEIPKQFIAMGTALGVGLAASLSGCSPDTGRGIETPPATHAPADPINQDPLYGGPEAARRLLGSNAALNIIDVQVSNAKSAKKLDTFGDKDAKKFIKDLHSPKGKFRTTIAKTFAQATIGRYKPAAVHYEKTAPIALDGGCVNKWEDDKLQPLLDAINKSADPDQVNIAIVEAFSCKPPEGTDRPGGFASPDMVPIVMQGQLEYVENAVVHETGHHFDLSHAGTAECDDVTTIRGCDVSETLDDWSVMSYTWAEKFTPPELYKLGLLREDEVADLRTTVTPQEVTMTDMSHKNGIKLVIAKTAVGNDLFLSWDKDPSAGYEDKCVRTTADFDVPKGIDEFKDGLYWTSYTTKNGKEINFACYEVNKTSQTHSLQMRVGSSEVEGEQEYDSAFGSFVLVTPKGQKVKGTNWYINQRRPFMNPPQKVYAGGGDSLPIAYVSANNNKTIVRIG